MAFIKDRNPYMVPTYVRPAPMMLKGQGCYLWDMENRRYLDFTAGIAVNSLGHCDPEIAQIIAEQVCTSAYILGLIVSLTGILGGNPNPLFEPLSQPVDWSSQQSANHVDAPGWCYARCIPGFCFQFGDRGQRGCYQVRSQGRTVYRAVRVEA